jgi:hypothetical protein
MDTRDELIDPSSMVAQSIASRLAGLVVVALLANGCGSKPPPEPESASTQASADAPSGEGEQAEKAEAPAPSATAAKVEGPPAKGEAIPDDYLITEADCAALGKQFTAATRADQMAGLDPRLSGKQRADTEKRIEEVAGKMGATWTETCLQSLVGKAAERKRLSCALEARSVKAFDTCINGD